ncbi:MAG TPA: glycoside hydrolase family 20 zincin-like fold domain-containing protein [Acidobacteriaceae bacterium]
MRLQFVAVAFLTLSLAVTAQTPQPVPVPLIPVPREYHVQPDRPLLHGVQIVCTGCDAEDQFAAGDLRDTLAKRGVPTDESAGLPIRLQRNANLNLADAAKPEGYTITAASNGITLSGATAEGVFYAAQTFKQMIEDTGGRNFVLHAADIRDWPAMKYRGLDDDMSRGPIDTLEFQKKVIRTIAAYKCNLYSPYFENTQQYASNPLPAPPGGSISAADARELVAYARQYHVMVVPEQEAFGHVRHMLVYEQYQPLAETPHGSVLAPGQPGSLTLISQMFGELAQLYPSPFLHVGADETEDLGLGQTKAAVDANGLGKVYLDFMQQIDATLRPLNRRLLFWGDIAQHEPDLLKAMPEQFKRDTIAIGWQYSPNPNGFIKYMKPYTDAGFETWVSPGINNWNRVYPNYSNGLLNIQEFTRDGQTMGSTGQLNTIWNDDGEALASNNWYGILFGAAAAWQQGESSIPQFEQTFGQVFHGDRTGDINQAQIEMMAAHDLIKSVKLGDGSDMLFWADPWAKDQQDNFNHIRPILSELRLHAEKAMTLVAAARAAAPAPPVKAVYTPTNQFPSNPTSLRETDAIDALELGARRMDFIGLKFQLADEMTQDYNQAIATAATGDRKAKPSVSALLGDINGVNGRIQDIKDGYSLIRGLYAQSWLRTNRPYALRPVLEHYDYTVGVWLSRMDEMRSAQRQWSETRTLPSPADAGMYAPPPPEPAPAPVKAKKIKKAKKVKKKKSK